MTVKVLYDISHLTNGSTYTFSFNVTKYNFVSGSPSQSYYAEIADIEKYIWLFTKEWAKIYEVFDKDNELTIHIVGNTKIKDMTRQQVQDMFVQVLDSMQTAGCNAVIFQVRPCADAFYKSEVEPWSRYLSGVQGVAPKEEWDPLEFMIQESHNRGMEVHAWCNPYRVTLLESDSLCADHAYYKHKEIFVKHKLRKCRSAHPVRWAGSPLHPQSR